MTLSDKIITYPYPILVVDDVREAVKELLYEFRNETPAHINFRLKINEIFGEKLTK